MGEVLPVWTVLAGCGILRPHMNIKDTNDRIKALPQRGWENGEIDPPFVRHFLKQAVVRELAEFRRCRGRARPEMLTHCVLRFVELEVQPIPTSNPARQVDPQRTAEEALGEFQRFEACSHNKLVSSY